MRAKRGRLIVAVGVAAVSITAIVATAIATGGTNAVHGELEGYQEVPSISTTGTGEFRAKIVDGGDALEYELSYSQLEGDVTQAHIHFGQSRTIGGIALYLCSNLAPPAGVPLPPDCPASGTVTGTLDADDVFSNVAGQGIGDNEFDEVVRALRAGATYVNVHSDDFPVGEVRVQLHPKGQ